MVRRDAVEAGLDIPAGNGVERAGKPIAKIAVSFVAVELVSPFRAVGIDRHILFEGIPEGGHGAGHGALVGGIGAAGDLAEDLCRLLFLMGVVIVVTVVRFKWRASLCI